jgi:type I restriction enzyme S subunit
MPIASEKDILVVWDGSIGKTATGLKGAIGSTVAALTPFLIETAYVESFIKFSKPYIEQTSRGTGLQHINPDYFWTLQVPLAPFTEQRRIVEKLEKLLHKVNDCQERLEKIPMILKRFRQSVLAAACSGRLTADWRKKNPPASGEQNSSNLEEVLEGWNFFKLNDILSLITSGSRGWAKYYSESGSIFIRAQNINADFLDLSDVAYVRLPKHAEGLRTKIQRNDLLITITGANVTKSALVTADINDAYVNQHVALVRFKNQEMSPFIFLYLISHSNGRGQLLESAYGQGKPGLNLDNIKNLDIHLPPLPEQQEIVRRVGALFKKADEIEARYKKAKAFVDRLTQSILAKAFRGELVPQDPNDEPASVLLERIKGEKARLEMVKKKGTKQKRSTK